jgi:hypothetical protein
LAVGILVDYCLADGDGSATMWNAPPDIDIDGNGLFDAVGLDVDGDGNADDALADLDGDGLADHAVLDGESYYTDDGSGAWAVSVDRPGGLGPQLARGLRWFGLDGVEHSGGPLIEHSGGPLIEHSGGPLIEHGDGPTVDLDGDGQASDRLLDIDGNGLADRALGDGVAYVDTDSDGRWDIKLTDSNDDGRADLANDV